MLWCFGGFCFVVVVFTFFISLLYLKIKKGSFSVSSKNIGQDPPILRKKFTDFQFDLQFIITSNSLSLPSLQNCQIQCRILTFSPLSPLLQNNLLSYPKEQNTCQVLYVSLRIQVIFFFASFIVIRQIYFEHFQCVLL